MDLDLEGRDEQGRRETHHLRLGAAMDLDLEGRDESAQPRQSSCRRDQRRNGSRPGGSRRALTTWSICRTAGPPQWISTWRVETSLGGGVPAVRFHAAAMDLDLEGRDEAAMKASLCSRERPQWISTWRVETS